ncbi:hypothetical protein B0H13DRAFT_731197 [Mycena leptocephala]|nr:hypothetical protein B0H13DRAFT_731197 [Mycena leptocephala]
MDAGSRGGEARGAETQGGGGRPQSCEILLGGPQIRTALSSLRDTGVHCASFNNNQVQVCSETAIEIHGVKIASPNQCEDKGSDGVFGHWNVNSEPSCVTYFGDFADKGCTSEGSRRRRFESRLWNLQSGDDWREMCTTTPADFRQMHFEGPDMCEYRGLFGVWGMWELEDSGC